MSSREQDKYENTMKSKENANGADANVLGTV